MLVKCVDEVGSGGNVTLGKTYKCVGEKENEAENIYILINDHGSIEWVDRSLFEIEPETPKEKLVDFLLSDEYITLLERAVASRYCTSTNNKAKHEKAMNLITLYKQDA